MSWPANPTVNTVPTTGIAFSSFLTSAQPTRPLTVFAIVFSRTLHRHLVAALRKYMLAFPRFISLGDLQLHAHQNRSANPSHLCIAVALLVQAREWPVK